MKNLWEERFANKDYVYGTEPNQFFKESIDKLNQGKALFIGEGEGRNSVYAARLGWDVVATDWSENAKKKALKLAEKNNVNITYIQSDIKDLKISKEEYDLIVSIFVHLESDLREFVHKNIVQGLKPGGVIIFEAYEKEQLKYNSGGPKTPDLLYSLEEIYTDFNELEIEQFSKEIILLDEGPLHTGEAAVIRYIGTKQQ